MVRGSDYTATDGSSVVLTSPLVANNVVQVISAVAYAVANVIPGTTITTKGDLVTGSAIGTPTRLPIGTNNSFLVADSTQATGIRWSTNGGTFTTWRKAAAGGETTLTGTDDFALTLAYTAGQEMVYINGVLLERGVDYTASNGTSVTGLTALVAGDIATVVTIGTFAIPDAITKSTVTAKGDLLAATGSGTVTNLAVGADGTTLVADSSTSTGLRYQGNVAGGKNVIINGGFDIWQRGTTFTSAGTNMYTADRYSFQASTGGTATQDTTSLPNGFRYGWKFTSTGSNSYMQSGTQIEFQNMENLQNNTVVISFYAKANNTNAGSTALTVRTRTSATVDASVLFSAPNSDTAVTLTTSFVRYSVTRTFTTFGAVSLEFVLGANVSTDGFTITGIQMELGSVATAFSRAGGNIQGELAACQRYYQRFNASSVYTFFCNGNAYSTTQATTILPLPVTLRTAPSSIETTGTASNYRLTNGATATACNSVPALDQAATQSLAINFYVASGLTAGQAINAGANNTASAYIGVSAEL
jgi:hypothetical protein